MKKIGGSAFFSIMMLIVGGCLSNSNQEKAKRHDTTSSNKKAAIEGYSSGLRCDTTISSQEFSYGILASEVFDADTNKIKSLFLDPVVLKIEKQTNNEGEAYDLHSFTDGTNRITLFKNGGFYVEEADIKNDRVHLSEKVFIGMEEDIFLDLLKLKKVQCDTISVKDGEFTFESDYIFKDGRLREIEMGQILE
jgi:hypothetical protein